jgi:hypothetical protein
VSIDYAALLAVSPAIKVAEADYDFSRDGGELYNQGINSQVIPEYSVLVGYAVYTLIGIESLGSAVLSFTVNGQVVAIANNTEGYITAALYTGVPAFRTNAARAIEGYVSGAAITAGAAKLWLFYLPN